MPLQTGPNSIRSNVTELMKPARSTARRRAILTIAKKNGISIRDAQFKQAKRIAETKARQ